MSDFHGHLDRHLQQGCCDDGPDPMEGKPLGICTWCGHPLLTVPPDQTYLKSVCSHVECQDWHDWETEDANRERYEEERISQEEFERQLERREE